MNFSLKSLFDDTTLLETQLPSKKLVHIGISIRLTTDMMSVNFQTLGYQVVINIFQKNLPEIFLLMSLVLCLSDGCHMDVTCISDFSM